MIAVDTNILVYAHRAESPFHASASKRVRELAESGVPWAIPWTCLHEFFGVVTHPRIYRPPTPLERAVAQLDTWLESPSVLLLAENEVYWPALRRTLLQAKLGGPRVHDARIASTCLAHGVTELWSADRDFSRYTELRVTNPLSD